MDADGWGVGERYIFMKLWSIPEIFENENIYQQSCEIENSVKIEKRDNIYYLVSC